MTFYHVINKSNHQPTDVLYFAFTYPYTYQDADRSMQQAEKKCKEGNDVYFHKETVIKSIEERCMDLYTITGFSKQLQMREP